jgi:hypothetical protein
MRWVKPLDVELLLAVAADHEALVTLEDGAVMGGAGSAVLEALQAAGVNKPVLQLGLPDKFIEHGDPVKLHGAAGARCGGHRKIGPGAVSGAGRKGPGRSEIGSIKTRVFDAVANRVLPGKTPSCRALIASYNSSDNQPVVSSKEGRLFFEAAHGRILNGPPFPYQAHRHRRCDRRRHRTRGARAGRHPLAPGFQLPEVARHHLWRCRSFCQGRQGHVGRQVRDLRAFGRRADASVRRGRRRAERHRRDVPHRALLLLRQEPRLRPGFGRAVRPERTPDDGLDDARQRPQADERVLMPATA